MDAVWDNTLYFMRTKNSDRPVLVAKTTPRTVAAEYGINEWILTDDGRMLGLVQSDLDRVEGPGLLAEGRPAVSFVFWREAA